MTEEEQKQRIKNTLSGTQNRIINNIRISITMRETEHAKIMIYDMIGRLVGRVFDGVLQIDYHVIT